MTEPTDVVWLDQTAAAARLSITTRTLRNWTRRGIVPVHQFPGAVRRYRVDELDALATPCSRRAG